jgi:hypothetical protein
LRHKLLLCANNLSSRRQRDLCFAKYRRFVLLLFDPDTEKNGSG